MSVAIRLTFGQMAIASNVAVMRRARNALVGLTDKYATKGNLNREPQSDAQTLSWETDIVGCQAELAVASYLNLFWCGTLNEFSAKDVGGIVEVRSVRNEKRRLILHPDDGDDDPFVLVCANPPNFVLMGWIVAKQGKRQEFWQDPVGGRAAFFVPQDQLSAVHSLRDVVNNKMRGTVAA